MTVQMGVTPIWKKSKEIANETLSSKTLDVYKSRLIHENEDATLHTF